MVFTDTSQLVFKVNSIVLVGTVGCRNLSLVTVELNALMPIVFFIQKSLAFCLFLCNCTLSYNFVLFFENVHITVSFFSESKLPAFKVSNLF